MDHGSRRAPAIDPGSFEALLEVADGDRVFLRDVIGQYLGDGAALVDQLVAAASAGESEQMARAAHTLKSSSGHVGALRLSELADRLQRRGREGCARDSRDLARSAQREMTRVRRELEERLREIAD